MTPSQARAALGLSVIDMASLVGMTRQGWYKAERTGIVSPPVARLLAYIEKYGPELAREMMEEGMMDDDDDDEANRRDDERFLRAYPAAVKEGRWEEVSRLLSGKCRQLERKAAAANNTVDALVAALEKASNLGALEREGEHGSTEESESAGDEITAIHAQIKAALALARRYGQCLTGIRPTP